VSVTLDKEGIPSYVIHENVAWDAIDPSAGAVEFARGVDAICFGSLAQRSEKSRNSIQTILKSTTIQCLRIFDINLRQHFYSKDVIENSLGLANILKINEDEIIVLAELFNINGDEFEIINRIRSAFALNVIALTQGANGSWLLTEKENSYLDTPKVKIVDTVGAGDSFTAAMVAGLLHQLPLKEVHQLAVDVSAFVCTQKGATPELPKDLIERLGS
jgi:fructokinase